MAQRSILSFFSVKNESKPSKPKDEPESSPEKAASGSENDSPVKLQSRKKRLRIESSSSEEGSTKINVKKSKTASNLDQYSFNKKNSDEENNKDFKVNEKTTTNGDGNAKLKEEPVVVKVTEEKKDAKKSPLKDEKPAKKQKTPKSTKKAKNKSPILEKEVKSKEEAQKTPKSTKKTDNQNSPIVKEEVEIREEQTEKSPIKLTKPVKNETCKESDYRPSNEKYHPIDSACWQRGDKVPYLALSRTLEEIENTSARLKMIDILSNYLRSVITLSPEDFLPSVYLCLNKIGPAYEGMELGIAEQTLIRAISQSTGRTFTQIKNDITETGDLGSVAEKSRSSQKLMFQPAPLTVRGMFQKFRDIAAMTGQAAVNKKISMIQGLFVACKGPEARFLIRSLNGKLRIGLAEQSVLQAIAQACALTPPGQEFPPDVLNASKKTSSEVFKAKLDQLALTLKTTYCECPNYDLIVPVILNEGILALPKHCKITPGIPVKPMLAQPTKGVQEVLTRFEGLEFTCEWKYDGERAQIHGLENGSIKIYSRNQEDNTSKYPDIIKRMDSAKTDDVKSFILDCEAVAWDLNDQRILPFQVLSTRKRKDANEAEIKVQVCVFMFDLLYLNGEPLVRETLAERRRLLHQHFKTVEGQWKFATAIDTTKMEEVQEFLEESIKGQCEGLMVKTLKEEATYEIAKRSRNWLKLKKDYMDGVGDTLDLVVMGGYFGKGKRTGTYGGFLIGCYDEDSEEYQTLCKIGTGFTDENLQTHAQFLKDHIVPKAPTYYQHDSSHTPDHWFAPVQVWEVRCADLSLSPVHRAALGLIDPEKGISLRFPRFLRIRDDKSPEQATTARQVADMYKGQEQVMANSKGKAAFNEEDFY